MKILKQVTTILSFCALCVIPFNAVHAEDPDSALECKDGETQILLEENVDITAFDPSQYNVTLLSETEIPEQNAIAYIYTPGEIRCFWIDLTSQ